MSVCGSLPGIGAWNPKSALQLKTSKDEWPYWSGSTEVALSQVCFFPAHCTYLSRVCFFPAHQTLLFQVCFLHTELFDPAH